MQALRDKGKLAGRTEGAGNGAAGGVGTFAVQIANALGAEVTGVCSTANVQMVRSIGADHVIDYTKEDYTRTGQRYDLLVDIAGNRTLAECRRVLAPSGVLVGVGAPDNGRWLGPAARGCKIMLLSPVVSQRLTVFLAQQRRDDLAFLRDLIEAGKLTPVIDRTYPLTATRRRSPTSKRDTPRARSSSPCDPCASAAALAADRAPCAGHSRSSGR